MINVTNLLFTGKGIYYIVFLNSLLVMYVV